jgi:signal transduction histidine kinase
MFERYRNSEKLQESQKASLEKQEVFSSLAKKVAHDIRSPLTALNMAFADSDAPSQEKLRVAQKAIRRINDISNDLLRQSKKPIGDQEKSLPAVDITSLLKDVFEEKKVEYLTREGIELVLDHSNSRPIQVVGAPSELKRVFSNILNNSFDAFDSYDPPDLKKVSISLFFEHPFVHIFVTDNGKGMSQENLKKVGNLPFSFGKDRKNSEVVTGTGIGLLSAKNYLESIGGNLGITSEVNHGTIVKLSLKAV